MKRQWILEGLMALVIVAYPIGVAQAAGHGGVSVRSFSGHAFHGSANHALSGKAFSGDALGKIGRAIRSGSEQASRSHGYSNPFSGLNGTHSSGNSGFNSGQWPNALGNNVWGGLLNHYANQQYYHNQHKAEEESAKAYRDAAIVQSVTGLLGTIAQTAIAADARTVQPAPYAVPAPMGHYETRRVVVQEGHYEQYQEWIPPVFSRTTGQQLGGGYYETHTRWIPEVYQDQQVYVQP